MGYLFSPVPVLFISDPLSRVRLYSLVKLRFSLPETMYHFLNQFFFFALLMRLSLLSSSPQSLGQRAEGLVGIDLIPSFVFFFWLFSYHLRICFEFISSPFPHFPIPFFSPLLPAAPATRGEYGVWSLLTLSPSRLKVFNPLRDSPLPPF